MRLKICYVMWNSFTVGSLQFPNDSTIASLEANTNSFIVFTKMVCLSIYFEAETNFFIGILRLSKYTTIIKEYSFKPFVPNAPFLYLLKTSENLTDF